MISSRFKHIPRSFDGCVYVAELATGVVKVGFSKNPRTRLESLSRYVRRKFGTTIRRY